MLRLAALGVSGVLGLTLLTPAAFAVGAAPGGPTGGSHVPTSLPPLTPNGPAPHRTEQQQAALDALAKAKSTGGSVVVDAMTTEVSRTTAEPNGRLTTTDSAQPVRAKQGGGWADIDATLRRNADGTLGPAVASTPVSFSGGGTGPMATVATADGRKLAVGAPFALPRPTLSVDTATYADVLPGVDLKLTALPVGGWRDVIVVRTPEAAANPALRTLRFPVTAQGLSVASDDKGAITVKDDKGALRFRSPAPLQWDSSRPAATTATPNAGKAVAAPAAEDAAAQGAPSTAEAPGDGANVASIGARATNEAIELTPDPKALGSGSGPWYLDPTLVAVTSYSQGSVEVQENHKDAKNFNTKSNLSTGYCGYHSSDPSQDCGKEGRQRAYFAIGVNPAIYNVPGGAQVPPTLYTSTLNAQVNVASSPGTPTSLGVFSAPTGINGDTNWNAQPCGTNGNLVMDGCSWVGGQQITGTGPMSVDVTDMMKRAAAGQWGQWTIAIAPSDSEWNKFFRHAVANNPSITTSYDITPTVWWPHAGPAPGFADTGGTAECNSGGANPWDNPGWVGNNQNIYLNASSYSPAGQPLYTGFQMWDDNDPNYSIGPNNGSWAGSYNNPAPSLAVGSLSDGHQYGWVARSTDSLLTSPSSAMCFFRVDRTNPRVSIGSTDFPPSGTPNPNPAKYAGDWGTFTLNAEDPAPGPGLWASGVACIRVSPDPTPVVGFQCNRPDTVKPGQPYGFQPRNWGTNTLYAWAMDIAGNYSQPAVYNFYVPWKPGTQPVFGDVNNDQKPDIVLVDRTGDLRVIGATSDPSTSLAAPAAAAPGARDYGTTWADFRISHHGTFAVGQPVDEIVTHFDNPDKPGASILRNSIYVIPNDGTGRLDTLTPIAITNRPTCRTYGTGAPCAGYNATDWSSVSQVLAFGTPEGEATAAKPGGSTGQKVISSQTTLLTVENGNLYLFSPDGLADRVNSATLIPTASGSWADLELLNPGAANGVTTSTDKANPGQVSQTTLWARNRTTGDVFAYPLAWKADGTVDYTALTKPDAGVKIGFGVNAADYPRIGAGDVNADGSPDLWTVGNDNAITVYPGRSANGTAGKVDGFGTPSMIGYADASTSIHPVLSPGQCIDAWGGPRDGAQLALGACWNTPNQRFNLGADGTIRAGALCVSTADGATGNGTLVRLARCEDKPTQKWTVRPDGRFVNNATVTGGDPDTGRCIELNGWKTDPGTWLDIWDCRNLQDNVRWSLQPERTP
ncbi:RICIN domain-containing protein [Streptomyces sp. NRRL WC-3742]|uniref:RICIN domain-containing protein n=1 Tax=Streptomyces sp. NRRL WC-3742 TaxID=1463934 RepID=UPI0004C775C4|nr:RICIN domain-containing protein [Streptomyces sp. NRRL WC-3742]